LQHVAPRPRIGTTKEMTVNETVVASMLVASTMAALAGCGDDTADGEETSPAVAACEDYYAARDSVSAELGCAVSGPDADFCANNESGSECEAEREALWACQASRTTAETCSCGDEFECDELTPCNDQRTALTECGGGGV
jgi:hypothetical protein